MAETPSLKKLAEDTLVELELLEKTKLTPIFNDVVKINLKDLSHDSPMKDVRTRFHLVGSLVSTVTNMQCELVELQRVCRENMNSAKDRWEERKGLILETVIADRLSTEERKSIVFARTKSEREVFRAWDKVAKLVDSWMKMLDMRLSELSKVQKSLLGHVGMLKLERGIHYEGNTDPIRNALSDDGDLRNLSFERTK